MEDHKRSRAPKVAYLGPFGTYSHQSAHEKFGDNAEYIEQPNISAVFDVISPEIPYAVVPQENSTFGLVVETYDSLRRFTVGTDIFIRGEVTIPIQHCMVVRIGVKPRQITRILSHEQALGQCASFISAHYPNAIRQKAASTAKAAQSLLFPPEAINLGDGEDLQGERAAICSRVCARLFDGLEIIHENIQDQIGNATRFFVLSNTLDVQLPFAPCEDQVHRALIRLGLLQRKEWPSTNAPAHSRPLNLVVSTLLTTLGIPITRVDRRPSINSIPFEDVYFVELEDLTLQPASKERDGNVAQNWFIKVQSAVERAKASGVDVSLLGVW